MSLVAILAVGCKTKTKAPSREQIIADSLAIVKAKLDSSIQAQNEAVNNAALAGNDEELLKAMSELYKLHNLEVENDKALEQVEARLAAAATENGKEAKLEQPQGSRSSRHQARRGCSPEGCRRKRGYPVRYRIREADLQVKGRQQLLKVGFQQPAVSPGGHRQEHRGHIHHQVPREQGWKGFQRGSSQERKRAS